MQETDPLRPGQALLIDDAGKFWKQSSTALREQLHCLSYPGDLENDVIRNLGFVGLKTLSRSAFVKFNPRNVSQVALATVMYWLEDHQPANVCLQFSGDARPDEISGSVGSTIDRIAGLLLEIEQQRRVAVTHRNIKDISDKSPLRPVVDCWIASAGRCPVEQLKQIASAHTEGRYAVINKDEAHGFVFAELGSGLTFLSANARRSTSSTPLAQQADSVYFSWVQMNYAHTLQSFRPDLADVDACVAWPKHEPERIQYRRLLLPCLRGDTPFLFSANSSEFSSDTGLLKAG